MFVFISMTGSAISVWAQELGQTAPTAQIVVNGSRTDIEERRDFVAGKIIIGRKRIEESGVRTVAELLKREPAVTISGDGRIGLLNMPGYTQILVDGQPPMGSQTPTKLDLIHVEKIELVKSNVAEFGPYGIAGTINIVTRKTARKTNTQIATGISTSAGKTSADLSLSHDQSTPGSPLRFSASLSASDANSLNESQIRQTMTVAGQSEQAQSQTFTRGEARNANLILTSSATWQRDANESIRFSPEMFHSNVPVTQYDTKRWPDGMQMDVTQKSHSSLKMYALPLKWMFKPNKRSQVELSLRSSMLRLDTGLARAEITSAQEPIIRNSTERHDGRTDSFEMVYKLNMDGGHDLKMGAKHIRIRQDFDYDYRINGLPDSALEALGTRRESLSRKSRVFVQEEWRISDDLALNAGVTGEDTATDVTESRYRGQTRFRIWSPSIHVSKKFGTDDKRQLRFSVARAFKAPDDDAYTVRPTINPQAPCMTNGVCGPNTIETADQSGNIGLKPERSLGLNMAYERGIGANSQLTLEIYTRQITEKIGSEISIENVSWSATPRYVSRPVNMGDARTSGINVEMELALVDLNEQAPKITLRGSVGLASSRVSSLPGPDNRLDKQAPWTAKLGGSYGLQDFPLKFDVDVNWRPSVWTRTSISERSSNPQRLDLDASANWTINKRSRLIMSIKSQAPRTAQRIDEFSSNDQLVRFYTNSRSMLTAGMRFETAL